MQFHPQQFDSNINSPLGLLTSASRTDANNIICHTCGKSVPRKNAFFMYEFQCCSTTCLAPLRIKRQDEEQRVRDNSENERPKYGAFTYSNGGNGD